MTADARAVRLRKANTRNERRRTLAAKVPPPRRTRASRGGESFYTVQSLAEYLGVGPDTVYRLIRAGRLPGTMRLGRRFRIPKNAVDALDERAG